MAIIPFTFMSLYIEYGGIYTKIALYITYLAVIVRIITFISLIVLLIFKLIQTYRFLNTDKDIINVITRITILAVITLLIGLGPISMASIRLLLTKHNTSNTIESMGAITIVFSTFMNCLCMILSFQFYDRCYYCLCGCIHTGCFQFWSGLAKEKPSKRNAPDLALENIQSASTKHVQP